VVHLKCAEFVFRAKSPAVGEGAGRLLRDSAFSSSREDSWRERAPRPIQITSDLFALRNAYFSDEIFRHIETEFRRILRASGVEFLGDDIRPHFSGLVGTWEAFTNPIRKGRRCASVRFDHLILRANSIPRTSGDSKKLRGRASNSISIRKAYDRYELEVRL